MNVFIVFYGDEVLQAEEFCGSFLKRDKALAECHRLVESMFSSEIEDGEYFYKEDEEKVVVYDLDDNVMGWWRVQKEEVR